MRKNKPIRESISLWFCCEGLWYVLSTFYCTKLCRWSKVQFGLASYLAAEFELNKFMVNCYSINGFFYKLTPIGVYGTRASGKNEME